MGIAPTIAIVDIPHTWDEPPSPAFAAAGIQEQAIRNAGDYLRSPGKTERRLAKYAGGWDRWTQRGGRVTIGQVPYAIYRKHLPAEIRYVTFLRDPVDRVLAHRRESMQSQDPSPELGNLAVRFLIDDPDPFGELSADALAEAKANLRRFALVGIQERFEESMTLLRGLLGPEEGQSQGSQPEAQLATKDAHDRQPEELAESNSLDIELYSFACDLLDQASAGGERDVTPPSDPEAPPKTDRLSLESASAEDLRGLGMSVTQTKRVLTYREKHGITSFDQLDEVPGFPRQQLTEIRRRLSE